MAAVGHTGGTDCCAWFHGWRLGDFGLEGLRNWVYQLGKRGILDILYLGQPVLGCRGNGLLLKELGATN